jgi:hypothetical protein
MISLDYYCMKYGQRVGTKTDYDMIRKALGILMEDGVYAMFLWLEYKGCEMRKEELLPLLNDEKIVTLLLGEKRTFQSEFDQFCSNLQEVAACPSKLFLLKKILERTLNYALYHAKVRGEVG